MSTSSKSLVWLFFSYYYVERISVFLSAMLIQVLGILNIFESSSLLSHAINKIIEEKSVRTYLKRENKI